MRKSQKQDILNFINDLYHAHDEIKGALCKKDNVLTQNMLSECQEFAIELGNSIEKLEGEGLITISYIEEYCEGIFRVFESLSSQDNKELNVNKICKQLNKQLLKVENSVKNEIPVKKEIAFFPYKVSMWDSLESVYLAAKEDSNCDVYCVPIPYYDLNPDHSFGMAHYEGEKYPEYVEVTDWQKYNFEERKPDVIYIHNPYDNWNLVTSVHPRYYSSNLKKYTDTLVYIPYYSTSGSMSVGQELCPAYIYADYIVIQAPKLKKFFDKRIPEKKFLPFGSPKFDRIIKKCQNPPNPPEEWKEKIKNRRVFFYNTSINGMLQNTEDFLKKMWYVFSCFKGRDDVCLLWRPHPLLETTFDSMRPEYKQMYMALKSTFIGYKLGIYDISPDIENSIALCDAYVGDAGSSVTSLFGIVGKPLFILNNRLHSEPAEDSWRGEIVGSFNVWEQDRYIITQGNKLYYSEPFAYEYRYLCDLSEYSYGDCYLFACEICGKVYVCPRNVQNILIINENGIERKIELRKEKVGNRSTFCAAWKYDRYLLLVPYAYPAIVRYDTANGEIKYLSKNIDIFMRKNERDELVIGGSCIYKGKLYISSPIDNLVYRLEIETGKSDVMEIPLPHSFGCIGMLEYQGEFWMFPTKGKKIVRWNPESNRICEYVDFPKEFKCIHPLYGDECEEYPFSDFTVYRGEIYLSAKWGNMNLKVDTKTGEISEWTLPFEIGEGREYYDTPGKIALVGSLLDENREDFMIFSYPERKLYNIDFQSNQYEEIAIKFNVDELKEHEPGFSRDSVSVRYCCRENAFNSLKNFLDGNIVGNQFDIVSQKEAYGEIVANSDGGCGEKLHKFISEL